jgi:hypothetical protein
MSPRLDLAEATPRAAATLLFACLGLVSHPARAYTIQNELTKGCHEQITTDALRVVRAELSTAAPLPASENDQALINDLQFIPPPDVVIPMASRSTASDPRATTSQRVPR